MPSSYPGALDSLQSPPATLDGPPTHSALHTELADAVEAVQGELGTDPAGSSATVKARLDAMQSDIDTVTAPELGTDSVDTDAIQAEAVTPGELHQSKIWDPLHDGWDDFGPQEVNVSTGLGGLTARYKRVGDSCDVYIRFGFGAGSAITGEVTITLPVAPVQPENVGTMVYINNGGPITESICFAQGSTLKFATGGGATWSGATPIDGSDGDVAIAEMSFEVASPSDSLA